MDIKTIFLSSLILLFLDYIYLSSHTKYFQSVFKSIQNSKLNIKYSGVILCYLILVFFINYFILEDNKKTIKDSFFFGMCIYGVYEMTNYATIDKWPIYMVFADTIWGGILFSLTVYLTRKIKSYYKI